MKTKELTCIGCPMGCVLTVQINQGKVQSVHGNSCLNGDRYARQEVCAPARILTTTVPLAGDDNHLMLSVKTRNPIPKNKIFACIQELKKVQVKAPVHVGDLVLKNVANTGVDVVSTQNIG